MITIGSNQKLNVIRYVCQNKNMEHFSESSTYNVSALPSHTYASIEPSPFSEPIVDSLYAGDFEIVHGDENSWESVQCSNRRNPRSVTIDYSNKDGRWKGWNFV
jgi:hypothetical protein